MKKLILWESSCWNISPEIVVVWLIDSDEELLAAKSNSFAVKRTFLAGASPVVCLSSRSDKAAFSEKLTHRRIICGGGRVRTISTVFP